MGGASEDTPRPCRPSQAHDTLVACTERLVWSSSDSGGVKIRASALHANLFRRTQLGSKRLVSYVAGHDPGSVVALAKEGPSA